MGTTNLESASSKFVALTRECILEPSTSVKQAIGQQNETIF